MANLNINGNLAVTGTGTIDGKDIITYLEHTTGSTGGVKFNNGLILNWGVVDVSSNGAKTISYKYPYQKTPVVMRTNRGSGGGAVVIRALSVYNVTATNFTAYGYTDDNPVTYFAIGY